MNELLMRHLTKWTGGDLKFKGNKIVQILENGISEIILNIHLIIHQ